MTDKTDIIHEASLNILENVGLRLHGPEVLELVAGHVSRVEGDRVFFRGDEVMKWVGQAPSSFTLHARNSVHDVLLGGDNVSYAPGYGCPLMVDADGTRRGALLRDYVRLARLVQAMDCFHINGGILAEPQDVSPAYSHALMIYTAILNSDKALLGIAGSAAEVGRIMNMAGMLFGGRGRLLEKPVVLTLVNTLSPLQIDANALATIRTCADFNQPVIISPGPMAGATGPVTLAGNIALANAEALAAIAVCQMLRPGLPVVYGLMPTTTDIRTGGVSIGSPGLSVQTAWCARLARRYNLPCRGGGALTDAGRVSAQSGYESMMSMLVSAREHINLVLHSAGILAGFAAMSVEQLLVDAEIVRMVEYLLADLAVDEKNLALDVIEAVGPGGEYLTARHTMQNCRRAPWLPEISVRGAADPADFDRRFSGNLDRKLHALLDGYQQPGLEQGLRTELERYLLAEGVPAGMLAVAAGSACAGA